MIRKTLYPMDAHHLGFRSVVSKREHERAAIDPTQQRLRAGLHQIVDELESQGYTTHPDCVQQGSMVTVTRNADQSIALHVEFPSPEIPVGASARADGGPIHGTRFAARSTRAEFKIKDGDTVRTSEYRVVGFDTGTGEWVYRHVWTTP